MTLPLHQLLIVLMGFSLMPAALQAQPAAVSDPAPAEVRDTTYLFEVTRHLYRWYLDENDLGTTVRDDEIAFWIRPLHPALAEEDHSQFAEILIPQFRVGVQVKKADYAIPELEAVVKHQIFKITNVERIVPESYDPGDFQIIRTSYREIRDYAHRHRNDIGHPAGDLLMRLRTAARKEIGQHLEAKGRQAPEGVQIIHLSPLSSVANETWVFWETGRLLIRFASDIDLDNPSVWRHEELAVDLYDIDEQVVVSLDEVAGSNAYLTRDQVGRVLFNSIVLGLRLELEPLPPGKSG